MICQIPRTDTIQSCLISKFIYTIIDSLVKELNSQRPEWGCTCLKFHISYISKKPWFRNLQIKIKNKLFSHFWKSYVSQEGNFWQNHKFEAHIFIWNIYCKLVRYLIWFVIFRWAYKKSIYNAVNDGILVLIWPSKLVRVWFSEYLTFDWFIKIWLKNDRILSILQYLTFFRFVLNKILKFKLWILHI